MYINKFESLRIDRGSLDLAMRSCILPVWGRSFSLPQLRDWRPLCRELSFLKQLLTGGFFPWFSQRSCAGAVLRAVSGPSGDTGKGKWTCLGAETGLKHIGCGAELRGRGAGVRFGSKIYCWTGSWDRVGSAQARQSWALTSQASHTANICCFAATQKRGDHPGRGTRFVALSFAVFCAKTARRKEQIVQRQAAGHTSSAFRPRRGRFWVFLGGKSTFTDCTGKPFLKPVTSLACTQLSKASPLSQNTTDDPEAKQGTWKWENCLLLAPCRPKARSPSLSVLYLLGKEGANSTAWQTGTPAAAAAWLYELFSCLRPLTGEQILGKAVQTQLCLWRTLWVERYRRYSKGKNNERWEKRELNKNAPHTKSFQHNLPPT